MLSLPTDLFVTLLEIIEHPDDPRAHALRSRFDCVSVSGLLIRLVKADETESLELQRQTHAVLASERGEQVQ